MRSKTAFETEIRLQTGEKSFQRIRKLLLPVCFLGLLFFSGGCAGETEDNVNGNGGNFQSVEEAEEETTRAESELQTADLELQAAEKLGFVLEGVKIDEACSEKMFYELLRKMISKKHAVPDDAWEREAAKASEQPMLRAYAARALYFAVWQTDYEVDPQLAEERGYFEFGATEANAWLETPERDSCILVDNLTDYTEFSERLIDMDGGWKYVDGKRETIPTDWTISFCIQQMDKNTGRRVMELDEQGRFLPFENITAKDAVKAVYRLYRSVQKEEPEKPAYINVREAGKAAGLRADDQDNPFRLPDVSFGKLPAWRGAGYSKRMNSRSCEDFSESDIRFLGENGFNFVRLMFGFSTLQGPDYPEDGYLVNEKELERLDELIGWGLKYGVHIQICMHGQPGRHQMENYTDSESGEYIVAENYQSGDLYPTAEEWKLIGAYWRMLARRYADIPNRFLTFDLMNEWSVQKDEVTRFADDWKTVIGQIWEADADRVLVASFDSGACAEAVEAMAACGVSISCHCYNPGRLCHYGASYIEKQYLYLKEPEWPMPYFPCTLDSGGKPLTIRNETGADKLMIYLSESETDRGVDILADGTQTVTLRPEYGRQYDKCLEVSLPEKTENITLTLKDGFVRIGMLTLTGGKQEVTLTPHDVFSTGKDKANGTVLIAKGDGSFLSTDGRLYTADDIYEECLAPFQKMAAEYGVGFMVNEFGIFGGAFLSGSTATDYFRDMRRLFEEHEIGFAFCEVNGEIYLINDHDEFGMFRGDARTERITWEYPGEVFRADTFFVEKGLLEALTQ